MSRDCGYIDDVVPCPVQITGGDTGTVQTGLRVRASLAPGQAGHRECGGTRFLNPIRRVPGDSGWVVGGRGSLQQADEY